MPQRIPLSTPDPSQGHSRLFFALWPDEALRDAIYKGSRGAVEMSGGRPVPRDNLHITLAFLGGISDAAAEQAAAAADEVLEGSFEFALDEFGCWPTSQVVWYGCSTPPAMTRSLALKLRERLQARSLRPDANKFVPHVTLARWVHKAGPFMPATRIPWQVREFALIRSETHSSGVEYTPLARWPLGRQGVLI